MFLFACFTQMAVETMSSNSQVHNDPSRRVSNNIHHMSQTSILYIWSSDILKPKKTFHSPLAHVTANISITEPILKCQNSPQWSRQSIGSKQIHQLSKSFVVIGIYLSTRNRQQRESIDQTTTKSQILIMANFSARTRKPGIAELSRKYSTHASCNTQTTRKLTFCSTLHQATWKRPPYHSSKWSLDPDR